MAKRGIKNKIKRSCQKQSKQNKKQPREKELYIFFRTLARPKAAGWGCRLCLQTQHRRSTLEGGEHHLHGGGWGRWLQLRRTRGAGNAPPEAAAPPAQPASPPGSLARSGPGRGRGRGSAGASQGEMAPSPHRAQCPHGRSVPCSVPWSSQVPEAEPPPCRGGAGCCAVCRQLELFQARQSWGREQASQQECSEARALGQAACSEAQSSDLPSPCQPLLSRAPSGEAGSGGHGPGGGRSGEAGSGGHGPGRVSTVSTGRGRKPRGGEVAMLQVTDAPWCHPGAGGWWQPREGSKGWLRAELWGAGHGHTLVSTHLFSGEGLLFGRGVGVSPAWGGASSPFLWPVGQSHWEEGLKARLVEMEG
ncbi:PREDICTED: translation initiation factor IF-2-like [Myotis brandtii]|uniref:translation initiation factor IF-2-like n=1 Tax=Myotis brandtii TaxID=109478 RepID=UPI000703E1B4|nr:PREDICTED: translation initiation factor IF-2-like [Myotis brandtii]